MMADHVTEELLSAYLDGELTSEEIVHIQQRLEESLLLREQLAALQEVSDQVKMLPRPYAPVDLRANILDCVDAGLLGRRVQHSGRSRFPLQKMLGWSSVAAVALLLVVGGWLLNPEADMQHANLSAPHQESSPTAAPLVVDSAIPVPNLAPLDRLSMAASEQPAVPVISLSKEEIRHRIADLNRRPVAGNSIRVPGSLKSGEEETPIVVVFTVVDVMDAMNQMQVLLKQQQVRSRSNEALGLNLPQAPDSQLTAVTLELEMEGPEMAAVLNSVAAYDAVMYVEQGNLFSEFEFQPAPEFDQQKSSGATSNQRIQTFGAQEPSARSSPSEESFNRASMNRDAETQRQFSFPQLVERSQLDGDVIQHSRDASAASTKEKSTGIQHMKPATADVARSAAPVANSVANPRGAALAESASKDEKTQPAPQASMKDVSTQGDKLNWEETRRFRAFILLKQQPAAESIPKKE